MMEKIYKLLMVGLININKLQFKIPTIKWVVHRHLSIDKWIKMVYNKIIKIEGEIFIWKIESLN